MKIAIRAQYPELGKYNWYSSIEPYHTVGNIELAFHSPEHFMEFVEPDAVIHAIDKLQIGVPTIHMAHANLNNLKLFLKVLEKTMKIAKRVKCNKLIVHPTSGNMQDSVETIETVILPRLEDNDMNLLWETFSSKRRFLTAWEDLALFAHVMPRNFVCYDIVHMKRESTEEVIEDIETYYAIIKSFHFSNWYPKPFKQHLPIGNGIYDCDRIVGSLLKSGFDGVVTLEYLPNYHNQLVNDGLHLLGMVYK